MEDNHGNTITFEESNMFNFGTEIEYKVKKASAECELEWHRIKDTPNVTIWRIENFNVRPWPEDKKGSFYDGDSYIVLNTSVKSTGEIHREAHMWVGCETTSDESGTAAYKIVELDDFFDRKVTLVWNSQGSETTSFLSIFGGSLRILHGGVNSGFKKVEKEIKNIELFEIFHDRVIQVKPNADSLTSKNSFVLDTEDVIYLWRGKNATHKENFNAASMINQLKIRKSKIETNDICQGEEDEKFWEFLGGKKSVKNTSNKHHGRGSVSIIHGEKKMCRISNSTGEMKIEEINFDKTNLISDDIFLVYNKDNVILWIGLNSSNKEKIECMNYARNFIKEHNLAKGIKIFIVNEGSEPDYFETMF